MPFSRRLGVWLLSLASLSGCYTTSDRIHQEFAACSNKHRAMKAWCQCRSEYAECQEYLWDFGAGFRQGYADVAGGSDGCTPAVPPRKYWSHFYKSAEGQCAVVAWFDGYQHGAAVAVSDGANAYSHVPTSDEIYRRNCPTTAMSLQQYQAAHGPTPSTAAPMDGGIPPIPEPYGGGVPSPGDYHAPYSPDVLPPQPPEEFGPSAAREAISLPVF